MPTGATSKLAATPMHQIGEVAEDVGLSLRTIRHYEEVDLVMPSGHTAGGFRLYSDDDIERLRLVKQMKPLDFTLDEIRDLLAVRDRLAGAVEDDERKQLADRLTMYAEVADERCEKLREQLTSAQAVAEMLQRESSSRRRPSRSRR